MNPADGNFADGGNELPYWRTFYHLIWATDKRAELIVIELEDHIQRDIRSVAKQEKALVHAVGFMPDHVHVVASIPPATAVSNLVGKMKGSSSHMINSLDSSFGNGRFAWQTEYGVVTFGEKSLAQVTDYVLNQKRCHGSNTIWTGLERTGTNSNRR
jgi:putative transposase